MIDGGESERHSRSPVMLARQLARTSARRGAPDSGEGTMGIALSLAQDGPAVRAATRPQNEPHQTRNNG